MKIDLSKTEIEMIERGLEMLISDYCIGNEDKPYMGLLDKLKNLSEESLND